MTNKDKPCRALFGCIIASGVVAFALIVTGISVNSWWHSPSAMEAVSPVGNITTYQLFGLWKYDSDVITKYKTNDDKFYTVTNRTYVEGVEHKKSDIPGWYEAVRVFQVIGCVISAIALFMSVHWTIKTFKSDKNTQCSCYAKVNLATYVIAGIFTLLGIIIMVGKTRTDQIAWAPTVAGFGGAFCIIAASFIRWGQQNDCDA